MDRKMERGMILFGKIMVVILLLMNGWVTYKYYFNFINSDDASELILARMLANDRGVLSKNWYYSTELEILNTQLVYSFLFRFISNFKIVRILGQAVLTCIFLGSYYFCLYSIDSCMASKRFWRSAFLMLLPISPAWIFLIMKTYYIPHVSISFLALGFACQIQNKNVGKRRKVMFFALGCLLAFLGCLEGMRHIQLTYLPLVGSFLCLLWNLAENAEWDLKKIQIPPCFWASICWLLAAGAGCLVNLAVLSKIYHFASHEEVKFQEVFSVESVQNVWNAFLEVFGYIGGKDLLSIGGICNTFSVLLAFVVIYYIVKSVVKAKKYTMIEQSVVFFVVISFVFSIFIFVVLGSVTSRWVLACFVPLILLFIFLDKLPLLKQYLVTGGIYFIVLLFGICGYWTISNMDDNEDKRSMIEFIINRGYEYGYYTSFWEGNVITELTNGQIMFRGLRTKNGQIKTHEWLTPISPINYDGAVIGIIRKDKLEEISFQIDGDVVYEDEKYLVYEAESDGEMRKVFQLE